MSKSNTQVLIMPGETGWEVWSSQTGGSFELQHSTDLHRAGDLESIPAGELSMAFPLHSVTTLPLRVMTTDEAMFEDLAGLHAERLGMSADPLAGQLSDLFEVEREEEGAVLLSVWLKVPVEGDLPTVGPKAFDLSARVFAVEGSEVSIWQELGRWVFAIHQSGKLLYAQATACDSPHPDESLARELTFALMQLSMQGLDPKPERITVWSADPAHDLGALRDAFDLPVEIHERPHPVLPERISKLLPEDVRAARRVAQKRQQVRLAIGAVAAVYLLLIGWLVYGLWQDERRVDDLEQQAAAASPAADAYSLHMARWHELSDAVDINHFPVEILHRVAKCIPRNSGLRLTSADISSGAVTLIGEAPSLQAVNQFNLKISKSAPLERYDWDLPVPKKDSGMMKFRYKGDVRDDAAP